MSFWSELKRRKVVQVAVAYAVTSWLLAQIVVTIKTPLSLPGWTDTLVIVLLAVGFPIALILAWSLELTPGGVARTRPLGSGGGNRVETARAADSASATSARPVLRNSVAVLPFDNLSPNADDAYFAAGIHEEILSYLTKIKDVNVIARTSVKHYAETSKPISEIAAELAVGTVMEGSVRYAGDRVRVTVQLVDAATQNRLWSEVYERDLADVFAIQADIAANVAEALEAELSSGERRSLESPPTTKSSEAHALYLKAQALIGQGDVIYVTSPPSIRASVQSNLDKVIALDPEFAYPYALKALLYAISRIYDPVREQDWLEYSAEVDEAVRVNAVKALSQASDLALPHLALALNHQFNWRGNEAQDAYERALELGPNDSGTLHWYSGLKWLRREFGEAIRLARQAVALDPGNIPAHSFLGLILHSACDEQASLDVFEEAIALHPGSAHLYLHGAIPEVALGNEARALEMLRLADQLMPDGAAPAVQVHVAYGFACLARHDDAARRIHKVEGMIGDQFVDPAVRVWAALANGDRDEALACLRRAVEQPEYRQEVFVRGFIEENTWSDPVLDEPEFAALRGRLELTG